MAELSADIKKQVQKMDPKMKETVMWSAIYNAGAMVVQSLVNMYVFSVWVGAGTFYGAFGTINAVIAWAIFGALGGAIIGFILAMWFPKIMELQKKYLKDYVNSLYKLIFYPYILAAALSLLSNLRGVLPALVSAGVMLAVGYAYAKMMDKKLGKYYR